MKRLWFGVALLILLLVLGCTVTAYAARTQDAVCSRLRQAHAAAGENLWEAAADYCRQAEEIWKQQQHLLAAIADHEPMEEVEALFCQLKIYLGTEDPAAFAAACTNLEVFVRAIGEAHSISWWNIL